MTGRIASCMDEILRLKKTISDHDALGAYPLFPPQPGASSNKIDEAEQAVGASFPQGLRDLLSNVDGWQNFVISTDLFGTKEFTDGKSAGVLRRDDVAAYLAAHGVRKGEAIAFGASTQDIDVYLCFASSSIHCPNGVVWFASEEVERYESMEIFMQAMVGYTQRLVNRVLSKSIKK